MSEPQRIESLGFAPAAGRVVGNEHTRVVALTLDPSSRDTAEWIGSHRDRIRNALDECGIVLLRNHPVDLDRFMNTVELVGGAPLSYIEPSTPRTAVAPQVYTSTEYPPDQRIPLHNENSYADRWPARLFFLCVEPADTGGETPVADSRSVYGLIDPAVRERFSDGVVYTRTFRDDLGLGWQETFGTDSRSDVEAYCVEHNQQFSWNGTVLRTAARRAAALRDPRRGEWSWFNQAHLWHVSALDADMQEALREVYADADMPRNAFHADGTPIAAADLREIERCYRECAVTMPWRRGDLLVVDNVFAAHGRMPFGGTRRVLVAMT